jgi:hypothetical protein
LNDALLGDLVGEAAGHLAACAACQQQLVAARMPLESFKAVTLAWSERRSATMPVSLQARMLHNAAGSRRRAWMTAAAAVLAIAVAIPYGIQRHDANPSATVESEQGTRATASVTIEANEDAIARDNQMLDEIDRELDSNRASSEAIELQGVPGRVENRISLQMVQD